MKRSLLVLVASALVCWSAAAIADKPVNIKGKAPPADPPPARAKTTEAQRPFDYSGLGARDAAADKAVAKVKERCVADPMSREGPTPEEQARCNLAVAQLTGLGKKGAPSILAALDEARGYEGYYAVNRLFFALGKIDDKKVRGVVVEGFSTFAKEEDDEASLIGENVQLALEAMMGATPPVALPWEPAVVTDHWEATRHAAAAWKGFAAENADKTRKQIAAEHVTRARKEKASDDPAKAYRAIEHLVARAPFEALKAAKAYASREGLDDDVASAFELLQSQAEWRIEDLRAKAPPPKKSPPPSKSRS